jgi:hypothetical protein
MQESITAFVRQTNEKPNNLIHRTRVPRAGDLRVRGIHDQQGFR